MILSVILNPSIDSIRNVENYAINSVNRVKNGASFKMVGGGITVALVIKRLKERVLATGFVGGTIGEDIKKELIDKKIDHEFINVNGESRRCLIIIDPINETETYLNEYGPKIYSSEVEKFKDFFLKAIAKSKIICLSGSLPLGVPTNIYADLITIANKKDIPVILDTSNDALQKGILAKPFMVKANIKEVKEVLPNHNIKSNEDIIKAAKYFLDNGTELVVITRGKEESIMCDGTDSWKISPPDVKVINRVGSGDAFVGGFAVAIANGKSRLDAFKWGIATGAASVEKLKAGDITYDRVQELLEEIGENVQKI